MSLSIILPNRFNKFKHFDKPVVEDVFIPEAVEGSPEEKREYNEFVHSVLIPALKSENIRFVQCC